MILRDALDHHPFSPVSGHTTNSLSTKRRSWWCSFSDPHDPHVTPEPYASMVDSEEGELYDLAADRDQYTNLWDDPAHQPLKQTLCNQLLRRQDTTDAVEPERSIPDCLTAISAAMHAEEPVQKRTSYS